jgi:hypothetical protein
VSSKNPFGIDIATDALLSAGSGSRVSKDSILCCFIVPGGSNGGTNLLALVLFFQLLDPNFCSGSWGEKILYHMVKANHPSIASLGGY